MGVSKFLAATAASILLAGAASAATYTPDTLLGSNTLGNSSVDDEIAALEQFAGLAAGTLTEKAKFDSGFFGKDDDGNWFIDVDPNEPGYFVLKFGVGGTDSDPNTAGNQNFDDHYYFQNIAELTKLVWTDSDVNGLLSNCDVANGGTSEFGDDVDEQCRLSHYTTGSDVSAVPLPAAGWMLIAGVGGLVAMRRRKTN